MPLSCREIQITSGTTLNVNANITVSDSIYVFGFLSVLIPGASNTIGGAGTLIGSGVVKVTASGNTNDFTSQYTIATKNLSNLTVTFTGASPQAINTVISPVGFIIANTSGVSFNANETPGSSGTTVNSGTKLTVGAAYTLSGSVTGNGTIVVTHTSSGNDLLAQYTGSLTLTNLTINFAGITSQAINSTYSPYGYIITNSTGVNFSASQTPGSGGTVVNGKLIPINTATISGSVSGSGTIRVTHTGSGTNDLTAQYTGTLTLTNLTVDFGGSMAGQLLNTAISPKGVIISNTGASVSFTTVSQTSIGSNGIIVNANATFLVSTGLTVSCPVTGNGTIQVNHTGSANDLTAQYTGVLTTNGLYIIFNGITSQFINSALSCRGIQLNYWLNTNANINVTDSIWIKTSNSQLMPGATNTITAGQMFGSGIFEITHIGSLTDDYAAQYIVTSPAFSSLSVTFAGAGSQVLGTAISCNSMILGNSVASTIMVNANISVSNSLNIYILNILSPNPSITIGGAGQLMGSGEADVTVSGNANDLTTQYLIATYNFTYTTIGFAGTAAQSVNTSFSPSKLCVKNIASTVTFNTNLSANNGTTVNSGAMLVLGAANTLGGPLSGNGTIRVTHTGGINDLTSQYTGSLTLSGLTIDFDGAAGQTLNTAIIPLGITITNTVVPVTFTANISPISNGTTVNTGAILIVSSLNTLSGAVKGNGTIEVTHTGSANDLTAQYTGTLTLTSLTINFNGASIQNLNTVISPLGIIITNTFGVTFNATETPGTNGIIVNGLLIVGSAYTLGGTITGNGTIAVTHTGSVTNDLTAQFMGTLALSTLTVDFAGASAQKTCALTYQNLVLNNGSGLILNGNVTVNNTFNLVSGILTLGANKLIITNGGSITGYSCTSYIRTNGIGVLEMEASIGGTLFPVGDGYNPITIFPSVNAIFDVSVSNGVTSKSGIIATNHAVGITWTVQLTSGSQNITIAPQWNGSDELPLFDRTNSYVVWRNDQTPYAPDAQWLSSSLATAASGAGPYYLTSGNISMSSASPTYLAISDNNPASPLPVTLITFNAEYQDDHVKLNWTTASEINNDYFDVERSIDATNWTSIGQVKGHGTSNVTNYYNDVDNLADVIPSGIFYYRLKQVDFNGAFQYSMIRSVDISALAFSLQAYPNPLTDILNVTWTNPANVNMTLQLVNISGIKVFQECTSGEGAMKKQINLSAYPAGIYILQIESGNDAIDRKIIVKN